jgi:regulator of cell morphogenesis and NO signaling
MRFHAVHRRQLPELIQLGAKVASVRANHTAAPRGLTDLVNSTHNDLLEHMQVEEAILFPMVARFGNPFVVHPTGVMRSEPPMHAERLALLIASTLNATA